jgi:hypothetical protein
MAIDSHNRTALDALVDIIKSKEKFLTDYIQFLYVYKDVQIDFVSLLTKDNANARQIDESVSDFFDIFFSLVEFDNQAARKMQKKT